MRQYFANVTSNNEILINHENRILRLEEIFGKLNKEKEIKYFLKENFTMLIQYF